MRQLREKLRRATSPSGKASCYFEMGQLAFLQQPAAAESYLKKSFDLIPAVDSALSLGQLMLSQAKSESARNWYLKAQALAPKSADVAVHLGLWFYQQKQTNQAEQQLMAALRLQPEHVQARFNLAVIYTAQGKLDLAEKLLLDLLKSVPQQPFALAELGHIYLKQGLAIKAQQAFEQALNLRPQAINYSRLGQALHQQGKNEEASQFFEKAHRLQAQDLQIEANLLNCQLNIAPWNAEQQYAHYQAWGNKLAHSTPLLSSPLQVPRTETRLKIAYLSADFREHAAFKIYQEILSSHCSDQFEVFAYASISYEDQASLKLKKKVEHWCLAANLSDQELAQQIQDDGIDILIDLGGQTQANRLEVMARRPAPILVTGIGHVFTSGLSRIDYRLTDRICTPEHEAHLSSEKPVYLPSWIFWPDPKLKIPPQELPIAYQGKVVLGSFNPLFKLNLLTLKTWAKILTRFPDSVLRLQARHFREPALQHTYLKIFVELGVAPQQIWFAVDCAYSDYLSAYQWVDICLDSFPYSGGLTSCDTLWMNTPLITLDQGTRGSASLLHQIKQENWVARNCNDYIDCVSQMIEGLPHSVKSLNLRERLLAAPVCQPEVFVRSLEQAYLNMVAGHV